MCFLSHILISSVVVVTASPLFARQESTSADSLRDSTLPLNQDQSPGDCATTNFGDNLNPNWRDISCSCGNLTHDYNPPMFQWADAGATAAWNDMAAAFKSNSNGFNLTDFIQDYFHSPPGFSCGVLGSDYCTTPVACGQGSVANAPVNSPAGYMIINSLVSLNVQFDNYYTGMQTALNYINGEVGEFTETFSSEIQFFDDEQKQKQTLDKILSGFAFLSAFTFNSWLKVLPFFKANGNTLGIAKDSTNGLVAFGINFVKDGLATPAALSEQNQVAAYVSGLVEEWVNEIATFAMGIFSDVDTLGQWIDQGQLFEPNPQTGPIDVTNTVQQFVYANVLPLAWNTGATSSVPFILSAAGLDSTGTGPDGCPTYDTSKIKEISEGTTGRYSAGYLCNEGAVYWLIGVDGDGGDCTTQQQSNPNDLRGDHCPQTYAAAASLPGIETLDGTAFGGLSKQNLMLNAINTVNGNLGYNADSFFDLSQPESITPFEDGDLTQARGLVGLPVCNLTEAWNNIGRDPSNSANNGFWPCTNNTDYLNGFQFLPNIIHKRN